ncbi:hypothetical protein EDC01DRAFT_673160 [Geopyxis carbonaria]|nr:hypothetical protein EDC01DRAFT_673160 [Geopyxis carbonaria]
MPNLRGVYAAVDVSMHDPVIRRLQLRVIDIPNVSTPPSTATNTHPISTRSPLLISGELGLERYRCWTFSRVASVAGRNKAKLSSFSSRLQTPNRRCWICIRVNFRALVKTALDLPSISARPLLRNATSVSSPSPSSSSQISGRRIRLRREQRHLERGMQWDRVRCGDRRGLCLVRRSSGTRYCGLGNHLTGSARWRRKKQQKT